MALCLRSGSRAARLLSVFFYSIKKWHHSRIRALCVVRSAATLLLPHCRGAQPKLAQVITVALGDDGLAVHQDWFAHVVARRAASTLHATNEDFATVLLPTGEPRSVVLSANAPLLAPYAAQQSDTAATWSGAVTTVHRALAPADAATPLGVPLRARSFIRLLEAPSLAAAPYTHPASARVLEDFEDGARFALEACDAVSGFHVLGKVDCGLGSLAESVCVMLKDQARSAPIVNAAFQEAEPSLSLAVALARLAPLCLLTLPLVTGASAKCALALDLATMPHRRVSQRDMRVGYAALTNRGPVALASLTLGDDDVLSPRLLHGPARARLSVLASLARATSTTPPGSDAVVVQWASGVESSASLCTSSSTADFLARAAALVQTRDAAQAKRFNVEADEWVEISEFLLVDASSGYEA